MKNSIHNLAKLNYIYFKKKRRINDTKINMTKNENLVRIKKKKIKYISKLKAQYCNTINPSLNLKSFW